MKMIIGAPLGAPIIPRPEKGTLSLKRGFPQGMKLLFQVAPQSRNGGETK
jgi:hypothetical protein